MEMFYKNDRKTLRDAKPRKYWGNFLVFLFCKTRKTKWQMGRSIQQNVDITWQPRETIHSNVNAEPCCIVSNL